MQKKIFLLLFILISFSALAEQQLFSLHGLQGLPGVKRKDGSYSIKSMKGSYIKDDTLVELLPLNQINSSNNFLAVRNLEEPHQIYFISKKWFARGAVKLLKDDNKNPPSYVEQFEVDPNKIIQEVEKKLAAPQTTCDSDGSYLNNFLAPTWASRLLSSEELKVIQEDKQPQNSIWRDLFAIRKNSLASGQPPEQCIKNVRAEYNRRHAKGEVMWSKYSVKEKLRRIDIHARYIFNQMKEKTAKGEYPTNAQLAPQIQAYGPAVAKCIAYHEPLNIEPQYVNYAFCAPYVSETCKPEDGDTCFSTANGLMHITNSTFKNYREAQSIPLLINKEYNKLDSEEIFKDKYNGDVSLQLEAFYHILSAKIREKEIANKTPYENLLAGVAYYDSDNQSVYIRDFKRCISCLNTEKKSDAHCYCQMRKHSECKSLLKSR